MARFLPKLEFWQQLVIAFTLGITLLAVATSSALTYIANRSVKQQIVDQGIYLTESVGRQARLALLYQSAVSASDTANIAMQFPDVTGVEIRTESGEVLYREGARVGADPTTTKPSKPVLVEDSGNQLVFQSPVYTQPEQDMLWEAETQESAANEQLIGYVSLVLSKSTLNGISSEILRSNILISTAVAVVLLITLLLLTRRLTIPLRALSRVMRRAQAGETNLRASMPGPRDIENMQRAFNTMMSALETRNQELRAARDQALESAQIKSQFAANVSHELRTPMNSVLGMLDLLSAMGLDNKQYNYVETAKDSAQELLSLIDDILSYVHADSGSVVLDTKACDIPTLLEEIMSLMATQAMKKKLDIGYVVRLNATRAYVDPQRLRQILINLVGNAIKFTENGEVSVNIELDETDNDKLAIKVMDTGIGINKDSQAQIFEAFTQEDSSTTRRYGGTGLGLAICKQFVELMGGEITVTSEKGRGSTFSFTIPYRPIDEPVKPEQEQALSHVRILVADDSEIVPAFIQQWCEGKGAEVTCASNALELLNVLNDADDSGVSYDYLFIDEDLPGVNLGDLLSVVQQHESANKAVEVVLVNPWTVAYKTDLEEFRIVEKPILAGRLQNFFSQSIEGQQRLESQPRPFEVGRIEKKVLVVDDNHANRLVAGGMLEKIGCDYEYAMNGQEAVDVISRKSFDLILMDCNMPVMDGYEATGVIRKLEDSTDSLPIVAMTANNSVVEKDRCLNAGMDDFIAKPLTIDALHKKLVQWVDGRELDLIGEAEQEPAYSKNTAYDPVVVNTLKNSVGEVFEAVVEAFLEDVPIYLESLKTAISRADSQQVYELAHTIKGSVYNFGAGEVADLAKSIEEKGKRGDLVGCDRLYSELGEKCQVLMTSLRDYLAEDKEGYSPVENAEEASTILVADDDRAMRLAFSNALRDEGYRILEASNGQNTLALCSRSMPNLILIDAIMPELDGFATCKQIRELPGGADVPILMVTALEDEQSIARAFNAGATDYITKPANFSVLRQRVARLLQTSRVEKHVRELAYHDVLTGLPNRAYFNQQLRYKISRAKLNDKSLAILFLDLDRFKLINDSLGHDAGDLILKAAGERINRCVRKNDLVARLGGDEFTVVLEDIDSPQVAGEISEKICSALNKPFVFLQQKMFVSASIGISLYPNDGSAAGELLKHADTAMFKAKESGQGHCYYQPGMEDEITERLEAEQGLRHALENGEIGLNYQPQINLETGAITGVEALARWRHPERGVISAGQFITVAEEVGLIGELGTQIFKAACEQLQAWHEKGLSLRLAVNVSGGEFHNGQLRNQVFRLLDEMKFPAELLEIEITETMLMDQPELAQTELEALRQRGVSIAIDDFGSGFSSLNYLKRFSVDALKIDREFVRDCHRDKNDQAIISGVVTLAKTLGLQVIAEGVEQEEQAAFLRSVGCEMAQGFYFAKPVEPELVERMLEKGNIEGISDQ